MSLPAESGAQSEIFRQEPVLRACNEVFSAYPDYLGTFIFGTPGGADIDLRPCFSALDGVPQEAIRSAFMDNLRKSGIFTEVDLLFMEDSEFRMGIRDLVELGDVKDRLRDGFDPHEQQAAVGDTTMFSLYIFATMQELHRRPGASLGSPAAALDSLELTREGAIGWMHFYTGCFLHEYLGSNATSHKKFEERLAKYLSRVVLGNTLAQLSPAQLSEIKPQLVDAIQRAHAGRSTDTNMSKVLIEYPPARELLDQEAIALLQMAGKIRDGDSGPSSEEFIASAQDLLFYRAFDQGIDRRAEDGEEPDPLGSYVLSQFFRDYGHLIQVSEGSPLLSQGKNSDRLFFVPLKKQDFSGNASIHIRIQGRDG